MTDLFSRFFFLSTVMFTWEPLENLQVRGTIYGICGGDNGLTLNLNMLSLLRLENIFLDVDSDLPSCVLHFPRSYLTASVASFTDKQASYLLTVIRYKVVIAGGARWFPGSVRSCDDLIATLPESSTSPKRHLPTGDDLAAEHAVTRRTSSTRNSFLCSLFLKPNFNRSFRQPWLGDELFPSSHTLSHSDLH